MTTPPVANARGALVTLGMLGVLAACSDRSKSAAPTAALPATPVPPASPSMPAPGSPADAAAFAIPHTTTQLVTATVADWTSTSATLRLWQRTTVAWEPIGAPWPAVVGDTGSAWGAGLHGRGAPGTRGGPIKREGDTKSPAGVFAIRGIYGYADEPPASWRLPYTASGRGDLECVDDPASEHYAKIIDRKQVAADWESAEQMLRDDVLYTWVVDLAHNPDRTPHAGSCIFLHVWSGPESSTLGCTAMDQTKLADLIGRLDPDANPAFVLLPEAEYRAVGLDWGLPPQ